MLNEMVWVIRNEDGYFVNPKYGSLYTGITSGFMGHTREEEVKKSLERLGEGYSVEYVNLSDIPNGERIYT
jgi:hypothetical protein